MIIRDPCRLYYARESDFSGGGERNVLPPGFSLSVTCVRPAAVRERGLLRPGSEAWKGRGRRSAGGGTVCVFPAPVLAREGGLDQLPGRRPAPSGHRAPGFKGPLLWEKVGGARQVPPFRTPDRDSPPQRHKDRMFLRV